MKIIIKFKNSDLAIIYPNLNKYGYEGEKIPFEECKALLPYKNGEQECVGWYVTDEIIDKSDLETREQLYWEDDPATGGTLIKKDFGWKVKLIPAAHIRLKHKKRLIRKIGEELANASPDQLAIARLNHELCCIMDKTDKEWYEQALINLAEDGHDKPEIVVKINEKIKELQFDSSQKELS